jgi:uncharacterized protein
MSTSLLKNCADIREAAEKAIGVGYRNAFRDAFLSGRASVSWIEVISERHFRDSRGDTVHLQTLRRLRQKFPVALHGINLSLASPEPPTKRYLDLLHALVEEIDPWLVTDHLSWNRVGQEHFFCLWPFPFTREALSTVCNNVRRVQDYLKRAIAIENITFYLRPRGNEMAEEEFFNQLCARTGCKMLLDINNLFVNSVNFGFDPRNYLRRLDLGNVAAVHLAGPWKGKGGLLIDTHSAPVWGEAWNLYEDFLTLSGRIVPTMIERDQDFPAWEEMEKEVGRLRDILARGGRYKDGEEPRPLIRPSREVHNPFMGDASGARDSGAPPLKVWQEQAAECMRGRGPAGDLFLAPVFGPSFATRLGTYRVGYRNETARIFRSTFPLTKRLLGQFQFYRKIRAFLAENPENNFNFDEMVRNFGARLRRDAGEALRRSIDIDLLAEEAARAPLQEEAEGLPPHSRTVAAHYCHFNEAHLGLEPSSHPLLGLSSSVRFYFDGKKRYLIWRSCDQVRLAEIDLRTERLLRAFPQSAGLPNHEPLHLRLGEPARFVQDTITEWISSGVICFFRDSHSEPVLRHESQGHSCLDKPENTGPRRDSTFHRNA